MSVVRDDKLVVTRSLSWAITCTLRLFFVAG